MADLADMQMLLAPPSQLPGPLAVFSLVWAFVFGACWGSFLNVVIARVPEGQSVVSPRSRCPRCEKPIAGFDNIPVLSWFILRGKCRSCSLPISPRYPFVETLVGLVAVGIVAREGWSLPALELFTFAAILIAIAFVDMDTWSVPHPLWISLVVAGLGFGAARWLVLGEPEAQHDMVARVIGAVGAGVFLGALVVVATGVLRRTGRLSHDQTAMGWGDPLILVGIGAFLGWQLLPLVVFLSSLQGAIVGLVLRSRGGLRGEQPVSETDDWVPPAGAVPFGPFLALGGLEAAFFGDAILAFAMPTFAAG